jgi:hypothetical protein
VRKKKRAFLPLIFFGVFEKEERKKGKRRKPPKEKQQHRAIHL